MATNILQRLFRTSSDSATVGKGGVKLGQARLLEGCRAYVIGDIHGRADLLLALLEKIYSDSKTGPQNKYLIFLGDYIDRGTESKKVIDIILNRIPPIFKQVTLSGNHEEAMSNFLDEPLSGAYWLNFGGAETLLSYRVGIPPGILKPEMLVQVAENLKAAIPEEHKRFLANLQSTFVLGDYMFVHAAIDPSKPLKNQSSHDLHWGNAAFMNNDALYSKVIVHGHTITGFPEFHANRISIDTGAYYSDKLTCLVLDQDTRRIMQT